MLYKYIIPDINKGISDKFLQYLFLSQKKVSVKPNLQLDLFLKLSMFPQNLKKWTVFPPMHESEECVYLCLLFHKLKLENTTCLQLGCSECK